MKSKKAEPTSTFTISPGVGDQQDVEEGESDLGAARRELLKELHLEIPLSGPVHEVISTFECEGKQLTSTDVFFLGRHESQRVELHFATEVERVAMKELRWWTLEELDRPRPCFQQIWRRFCDRLFLARRAYNGEPTDNWVQRHGRPAFQYTPNRSGSSAEPP